MSSGFDPYFEWLGIDPSEQPADHYRLLGLARFEANPQRIAQAADERMALVRTYQAGKHRDSTQRLLNELSAARVALVDPASKARYDADLARYLAQLDSWQSPASATADPRPAGEPTAPSNPPPAIARAQATRTTHSRQLPKRQTNRQLTLLLSAAVLGLIALAGGWRIVTLTMSQPAAHAECRTETAAALAARRNQAECQARAAEVRDIPGCSRLAGISCAIGPSGRRSTARSGHRQRCPGTLEFERLPG